MVRGEKTDGAKWKSAQPPQSRRRDFLSKKGKRNRSTTDPGPPQSITKNNEGNRSSNGGDSLDEGLWLTSNGERRFLLLQPIAWSGPDNKSNDLFVAWDRSRQVQVIVNLIQGGETAKQRARRYDLVSQELKVHDLCVNPTRLSCRRARIEWGSSSPRDYDSDGPECLAPAICVNDLVETDQGYLAISLPRTHLTTIGHLAELPEFLNHHYYYYFCAKMFRNLLQAVSLIHQKQIYHQDLTLDSVLLDLTEWDFCPYFLDFGIACDPDHICEWPDKSLFYTSPTLDQRWSELSKNNGKSSDVEINRLAEQTDLYSLGVIFFLLWTRQNLEQLGEDLTQKQIAKGWKPDLDELPKDGILGEISRDIIIPLLNSASNRSMTAEGHLKTFNRNGASYISQLKELRPIKGSETPHLREKRDMALMKAIKY